MLFVDPVEMIRAESIIHGTPHILSVHPDDVSNNRRCMPLKRADAFDATHISPTGGHKHDYCGANGCVRFRLRR